jgi:CDP-diacylglycerol--serine O-phosphatidyltransferase
VLKIKQNIPNVITCGNLLCGCLAIVKAFEGDLVWAAYLVGIAAVLDFFDGFAARLLKVSSPIGKELDSMADMVTFGVVPGIMMFKLLSIQDVAIHDTYLVFNRTQHLNYLAILIPIFSGVRLAKFNIDTRQTDSFIGVPTPANAMLLCSIPLIMKMQPEVLFFSPVAGMFFLSDVFLCSLTVIMSFLMVSEIPLFALKFKNFGWSDNRIRYIFLTCCLILLVCLQVVAIPIIILLYILFSVVNNLTTKTKGLKNK